MKKIILTAIILAMCITASAQRDYTHDDNHVYYHGMMLRFANIETFQDLRLWVCKGFPTRLQKR